MVTFLFCFTDYSINDGRDSPPNPLSLSLTGTRQREVQGAGGESAARSFSHFALSSLLRDKRLLGGVRTLCG